VKVIDHLEDLKEAGKLMLEWILSKVQDE